MGKQYIYGLHILISTSDEGHSYFMIFFHNSNKYNLISGEKTTPQEMTALILMYMSATTKNIVILTITSTFILR